MVTTRLLLIAAALTVSAAATPYAQHHNIPIPPIWALIGAGLIIIYVTIQGLRDLSAATPPRDTTRLFTPAQRAAATVRCGHQCEHKPLLWHRCRRSAALQGDHIYPWSKGGRTIESNLQMLCPRHNRRKTNSVPSMWYIWRLERRRGTYFPPGVPTKIIW